MSNHSILFSPCKIGNLTLPNRLVMAPMTRGRADMTTGTPTPMMAEYYVQRASAGLLVTEATAISPQGVGWVGAPGIYTANQIAGWQKVTSEVHAAGGRIFLQLWHMGRVSHPDFLHGELPVGPSAIAAQGDSHTPLGKKPYVTPRSLTADEISGIVRDYAQAAKNAQAAGFDGVEIHGANGYLIDQFLRDGSNQRTDDYGGSVDKRVRFLTEVSQAVCAAWAPENVGVRLSPAGAYNDMHDSDPQGTFTLAAEKLAPLNLAFLHLMEAMPGHMMHAPIPPVAPSIRNVFPGPLILNGGYTADTGAATISSGQADLIAYGIPFLANPDLVTRMKTGAPLNDPDFSTLYTPGEKGYTDYPVLPAA